MTYDKYRNWPIHGRMRAMANAPFSMNTPSALPEQVLKDLGLPMDDIEKLEILDSFAAWVKRDYQMEISEMLAGQLLSQGLPFLISGISGQMPPIQPITRPRRTDNE